MREWKSWRGLHKALYQAWFSEIGLIDLTKYEVGVFYETK
jgi:hypothetical protein